MKYFVSFFLITMALCSCSKKESLSHSDSFDSNIISPPTKQPISTNYISDLVLIYHGGTHRLDYTKEELSPYVYKSENGKRDWLFDGFLFIEFKDNRGAMYANGYGGKPANRSDWMWLLSRNFESNKGVAALNSILADLSKRKEHPKRKRKIVLTLPEPIKNFETWGLVGAQKMDFKKNEDRVLACKWYVDYVITEYRKQNFEHLDFDGFYWVAETQRDSDGILLEIGNYIRSKGLKFYWIPYMYAQGAEIWKEAGFDIAYQQPNYFFDLSRQKNLFTRAIDNSNTYKMGLEMEFDDRMSNPDFYKRFYDYIDAFADAGAWDDTPIAYYEGGGTWLKMFREKRESSMYKAYIDLADIIIKRQNKEDSKY